MKTFASVRSRAVFIWLILLLGTVAQASIQIPNALGSSDRREALKILGLGTSTKLLTDPYPLGGYSGFEFGLEIENLPTDDLAHLGAKLSSTQQDVTYGKLTIGKGLYENVDAFVQFAPYNQTDQISQYGALVRWGFYQAAYLPLSLSIVADLNSVNISNLVTTLSYGVDLIGGLNVNNVALYAGVGAMRSGGYFLGGPDGVTDTGNVEHESVSSFHTLIGATVHISDFFIAAQLDRYTEAVLSAKVGLRF